MKAGLRFVDICNNALRIQKPPPAPLPPNVLSYCWFQARSVCPQPRNDQQWVFLILSHRICVYLWHAAHRPELEGCCWPPNQGGLISCRQTVSSGAADGCCSCSRIGGVGGRLLSADFLGCSTSLCLKLLKLAVLHEGHYDFIMLSLILLYFVLHIWCHYETSAVLWTASRQISSSRLLSVRFFVTALMSTTPLAGRCILFNMMSATRWRDFKQTSCSSNLWRAEIPAVQQNRGILHITT